ncbi:MAG: glycosyltransferase family 39 protein [Ktedonobacteraceae bacterium]|nr:glycosyltransferase family 39 protein [Ktedonobacteraceae bacterium]
MSWEFYLILLLTVGLRLYRIDTAQYMTDHNTFYQMAHNAVANGLWPISGNRSSTGPLIPPLFIYLMMIPAAISPNPIAGNIFVALCNIAAVLLTYVFVRHYYGRLAATITALLYATAVNVIIFSRDIWQPDLLPLLMILLLFLLFRGVVQKKRYWFLPSVLLIAAMYQLHSTAVYLVVPLLVAIVLAFRTIRWRELPLTVLALLLFFSPYIYLEYRRQYIDILQLFQVASQRPAIFDNDALLFYKVWMHSFVLNPLQYQIVPPHMSVDTHLIPGNAHSVLLTMPLQLIAQFSQPESLLMELLLAGAMLMAVGMILLPLRSPEQRGLSGWWKELLNSPQRKGLLILLAWQATFVLLLRHSIPIYIHYFIYLLPGPFILIGLLLANTGKWLQRLHFSWERPLRYGLYLLVGLLVIVQTVGSIGWLVDHARGNFNSNYAYPQYFDLATIQRIVNNTDQLAQQHHLSRVYIDIHGDDEGAVSYMAQFAHTPTEVLDSNQCLVLPNVENGPVIYLTDPNRPDLDALLNRYANTTQVGEVQHPGGTPFKIYLLSAKAQPQQALQLSGGMQLSSQQAEVISMGVAHPNLLVTHWKVQNTVVPQPRTVYKYRFLTHTSLKFVSSIGMSNSKDDNTPICRLSRTWAGDDLVPLFEFNGNAPQHIIMGVEKFTSIPQHYDHGSLKMVIYDNVDTRRVPLYPMNGKGAIILSLLTTSR